MSPTARRILYDSDFNPVIKYFLWIQRHKSQVSKKVYKVYKELVRIISDRKSVWEYDPKKANHAIEFIENYCKHSKGKMGGKPFILELWQKALVAATFGFVHKVDGTRKHQEVLLIVARKNGKSTLAAAIGLYLMIADGEPGSEVYAAATKRDQAKIIWLEAKRMVKKSPVLLKRIKPLVGEMVSDVNDSFFKPLGSDSDTLDGLNVHGALMDEIHAWQDMNLYDVIVDGKTAREQPLIFITTTAGTIRESVYDNRYDEAERVINGYEDKDGYKNERLLPIIYELDKREEWTDPDCWIKANPGLGTIKKVSQLQEKVDQAKANLSRVKNLLCKDFNIRETTSEAWLTFEQLNNRHAVDSGDAWFKALSNTELAQYGLYKPMSWESWHVQLIETKGLPKSVLRKDFEQFTKGAESLDMNTAQFQTAMKAIDLYSGKIDGKAGPLTMAAAEKCLPLLHQMLGYDYNTPEEVINASQNSPDVWLPKLQTIPYFGTFVMNIVNKMKGLR